MISLSEARLDSAEPFVGGLFRFYFRVLKGCSRKVSDIILSSTDFMPLFPLVPNHCGWSHLCPDTHQDTMQGHTESNHQIPTLPNVTLRHSPVVMLIWHPNMVYFFLFSLSDSPLRSLSSTYFILFFCHLYLKVSPDTNSSSSGSL